MIALTGTLAAPGCARLTLGTVQFGMDYGIANAAGRVPREDVRQILADAHVAGVACLDTAAAYGESEAVPREVLVPAEPPDAAAMAELLAERRGGPVRIRVPRRGDKKALLETVARNAAEALRQHKTRRAGDLTTRSKALQEIQEALELPEAPLRIECYDVSNLQGTNVVASMVVFEDGLARKSEYRRFAIKTVQGQDDVRSIHEVITRRFKRYLAERDKAGQEGGDAGGVLASYGFQEAGEREQSAPAGGARRAPPTPTNTSRCPRTAPRCCRPARTGSSCGARTWCGCSATVRSTRRSNPTCRPPRCAGSSPRPPVRRRCRCSRTARTNPICG